MERRLGTFNHNLVNLKETTIILERSKSKFGQQVQYLGHVISQHGVSTDMEKLNAVKNWPQPQMLKSIRAFLGLSSYYRHFVQGIGKIAQPLTEMLKNSFH